MTSSRIESQPDSPLALVDGTVYISPTEDPMQDGTVLVQGTKIAAVGPRALVQIPQSAQRLDCSGLTIIAGFWNSHVHFFERKWAQAATIPASELARQLLDFTRYGFTSVFDLSSAWENTRAIRDRIDAGEVAGPRIRSTGEGLVPVGGVPPEQVSRLMGAMTVPLPEITDASQAANVSRELLNKGVDGIKLFASSYSGEQLPNGVMEAAVNEARRAGKPVFVHPNSGADVMAALNAGVDVIAHTTPRSGAWDEAILTNPNIRRVALTPTLTLWKFYLRHDRVSIQDQMVDAAIDQLRAWRSSSARVLFGTDLGAVDYDPSDEYALMARAGMNFTDILASLTSAPAQQFGESKRLGRIAEGYEADIVVLDGDPSKDIRAMTGVEHTLQAGKIVFSRTPLSC